MSRIRTLKPEFWGHEELSNLPEATHILAAALLNYADDFGYFNANPGLIRAACSPLREPSVSIPDSLKNLEGIGFIEVGQGDDGKIYGRVVKFSDHQRLSHRTESKIASKNIVWESSGAAPKLTRKRRRNSGVIPKNSGAAPEDYQLAPEPLRPEEERGREQGTGNVEEERGGVPACAPDDVLRMIEVWNRIAEPAGLPPAQRLTAQRKNLIRLRLDEAGGAEGLETCFIKVAASAFCRGEENGKGHESWRADLDWVLSEKAFTRIMEGKYDDRRSAGARGSANELGDALVGAVLARRIVDPGARSPGPVADDQSGNPPPQGIVGAGIPRDDRRDADGIAGGLRCAQELDAKGAGVLGGAGKISSLGDRVGSAVCAAGPQVFPEAGRDTGGTAGALSRDGLDAHEVGCGANGGPAGAAITDPLDIPGFLRRSA